MAALSDYWGHTILFLDVKQSLFLLFNTAVLAMKQQISIDFIVVGLTQAGLEH
jgi:hypothetical protein